MSEQQEAKSGIVLPTEKSPIGRVNPKTLILFGLQKCGKTTELSKLENNLMIDTEEGAEFVSTMKLVMPGNRGPVARYEWLKEVAKAIKDAGRPYDYVSIDTFTRLDEMAEWIGTYQYMNSIAGKKFNRETDANGNLVTDAKGNYIKLKPTDPNYESVHNLPNGYGYRFSRSVILEMYELLKDLGKVCTIFVCHVADKSVVSKLSNQEVVTRDISLTGKVKDIVGRLVDGIGYVYNQDGQAMISFKGNEEKIGGNRAPHIKGYEGPLDWSRIFIKETTN